MSPTRPNAPHGPTVLLVEDDADHAYLTGLAFEDTLPPVTLHHVETGEACLAFLRHQEPYADAPRPDLVLLDLHMPRMSGYEVMEEILRDEALRALPVVVMTSSSDPKDVERMYRLRCNAYMVKPVDYTRFAQVVQALGSYWFGAAVLPGSERWAPGRASSGKGSAAA